MNGRRKGEVGLSGMHDALLHGETLLVVAAGDLEDVALEFVANAVARNLLTHSVNSSDVVSEGNSSPNVQLLPLVNENTQLSLIFNVNQLLAAIGRLWCIVSWCSWNFRGGESVQLTKEMFWRAQS